MISDLSIYKIACNSAEVTALMQVMYEKFEGECGSELTTLLGLAYALSSEVSGWLDNQIQLVEAVNE